LTENSNSSNLRVQICYIFYNFKTPERTFSCIIIAEVDKISFCGKRDNFATNVHFLHLSSSSITKNSIEHIQLNGFNHLKPIPNNASIWRSFIWIFYKSKCATLPERILLCWRAQLQYFHLNVRMMLLLCIHAYIHAAYII